MSIRPASAEDSAELNGSSAGLKLSVSATGDAATVVMAVAVAVEVGQAMAT
eukprot:CAMPEP_0185588820 /NCGR_PEP_ID=MMETSP0434-20130131/54657_1 /TAXON_ID=626734 ORGANISM="Favella taraikaensis, Strain Fe Narragansett Bay" /NCGR_SAMPLE_ID=MMETSP0434 /ASSEMBLY_ACC=CAM_ASM_000379 /LENGTH=50 /DNA_ID=CAMNT_0028211755 /DNA_START=12 /DNA_END=165 /DNA_ORIENTATION=+